MVWVQENAAALSGDFWFGWGRMDGKDGCYRQETWRPLQQAGDSAATGRRLFLRLLQEEGCSGSSASTASSGLGAMVRLTPEKNREARALKTTWGSSSTFVCSLGVMVCPS